MRYKTKNGIGSSPKSSQDELLLKGEGKFVSDLTLANVGHAEFLRSIYPSAKILNIHCESARKLPGVLAIFTGADVIKDNLGSIRPFAVLKQKNGEAMFVPENLPLSHKSVVFVGDPIAVVIAENKSQALDALEAIEVDYQENEPVLDIKKAVEDSSPLVWPQNGTNECFFWSKGEQSKVCKLQERARFLIKRNFRIPIAAANPIEPRGCLVEYKGDNELVLIAPVQSPWKVRQILACQSLRWPERNLEVRVPEIGGSFGMKGQTYNEYAVCLWAARKLKRSIKWVATRAESFLADDQGRNVLVEASLALDKNYKFLSLYVSGLSGLGAYLSTRGTKTAVDNWPGVSGVYHFEAVYVEMTGVFTNTGSISPYRGAGRPEAAYVIERLVDLASNELNVSPVKLRELNFIKASEMPFTNKLGFTYDSGDYGSSLQKALKISEWKDFNKRKELSHNNGLIRGLGIACVVERSMSGQPEYASVRLDNNGLITLCCGAISFGQGTSTIFPQILREKLKVYDLQISYVSGDTRLVSKGTGSFGSRSTGLAGAAVALAAEGMIAEAKKRAAILLQSSNEFVTYRNGTFYSKNGSSIHLSKLANKEDLFSEAEYETTESTFPSGAHISEVEIDPETGQISLVNYCAVEDTGTVVNPMRLDGQMHGGIAQGVGQVLMEEIIYDLQSGQLLTGSFMDYAMPRAKDLPLFKIDHNPSNSLVNPLGVKGGGEGGTVGALVCVANAIANALYNKSTNEIEVPVRSFEVWKHLKA